MDKKKTGQSRPIFWAALPHPLPYRTRKTGRDIRNRMYHSIHTSG